MVVHSLLPTVPLVCEGESLIHEKILNRLVKYKGNNKDNLKKLKVQRPLLATVTETSINWDLKNLLYNLQEEAVSLNSSKVSIHKNS